jgi:DNA-binding NarL/FixJ family response regulator
MKIYQIFLVDDHPIFLKGLALMLNEISDFKVIGEASNGIDFLNCLNSVKPDVVLMDIKMPELNGIETTKKALQIYPDLKVIALTMFGEQKYLNLMAEAGALGFLQKSITRDELEKAIRLVSGGQAYFSEEVFADLSASVNNSESVDYNQNYERLTERETEVLKNIVKGLSAHEIAEKMYLSPRTVEGHRSSLISKTGTRNVVDLVIFAIRNKLVEI